jgi:hydrogenase maturation protein HypF
MDIQRYIVKVKGIVQGVGFRPFVYRLAESLFLKGYIRNTSDGVFIEVEGAAEDLALFLKRLKSDAPVLASINDISFEICPLEGYLSFVIEESQPVKGAVTGISPDISVCGDCRAEFSNPEDYRWHYPFINCTNCGPRFTIIRDIPYDRKNTTMASFAMCPECGRQYGDPYDRRYHAQPLACEVCGPRLKLLDSVGVPVAEGNEASAALAADMISKGKIIAVKGIGGYHLACNAYDIDAVRELRKRKSRDEKPFALMAFDLATVEQYAVLTDADRLLISSNASPILLLPRRPNSPIADQVAPNQTSLGFMLPYTPLHLLLLEPAQDYPDVWVMTSGNYSEEPIAYTDDEARLRLNKLADGFLFHNRPIHMRVDDSVARTVRQKPYLLRRGRGYAPESLHLPRPIPSILATGAELKNTFCLTRDQHAFLSHHIGDLENYETLQSFETGIAHYEQLFRIHPELIACDLHPDYLATRYAQQRAQATHTPLYPIQHHHAHLAACLADNQWDSAEPVIGLTLDGTGMGTDGIIWGGEILLGSYASFQRVFHLRELPLPGADLAIRSPARMALACLWAAQIPWEDHLPPTQALCYEERTVLHNQLEHHINTPLTTSMGRLFDAVAGLIGLRSHATYEAQAAIELEAIADPNETGCYPFNIQADLLDPLPVLLSLLTDWQNGIPIPILAARFHNSVAQALLETCQHIRQQTGISVVALSGGVWQNILLLQKTLALLEDDGFTPLIHQRVPTNDGGLALGQALIAAAQFSS